jgi:cytidylate kinase
VLVAIDGPAGAGKSTVARAVARALGFTYLDTGAMYRCVALAEIRGRAAAQSLDIAFDGDRVLLDGEDVSEAIRTREVSEKASEVAAEPEVRAALVARQRALIEAGDWVAEGRDIATVVAPDAEVKVFLTASPQERARRRATELGADEQVVARELAMRDQRDTGRRAPGHHRPLHRRGRPTDRGAGAAMRLDPRARARPSRRQIR